MRRRSDDLEGGIGANPVVVRKILTQLKGAGLISAARGTGALS
ncbi:MAG: Rrf2 family transcriptional regulator [Clostridia bacterium]|nr:Rrf2 family transcriptional regulator [Clostridia bacterium]